MHLGALGQFFERPAFSFSQCANPLAKPLAQFGGAASV